MTEQEITRAFLQYEELMVKVVRMNMRYKELRPEFERIHKDVLEREYATAERG